MIVSLENAESSTELLIYLKGQLKVNRTKRFGNGPVQKTINLIKQKLIDDFNMTDEDINKSLQELK